jgi:hypothetical protein
MVRSVAVSACLLLGLAAWPLLATSPQDAGAYLGQRLPGAEPELFAPGIVNSGLPTRDITLAPDGREIYFRVMDGGFAHTAVVGTRLRGGRWTAPEVPSFSADSRWKTMEPHITPDGRRFYYTSDRPADPAASQPAPMGLWLMDRAADGTWGPPRRLPGSINGADGTFFATVTRGGTLYYGRDEDDGTGSIWRARAEGTGFAAPEKLPAVVQAGRARYNPFIAADESYLIAAVQGLPDSLGGLDYYAFFRNEADRWSQPLNLGAKVNDEGQNVSATVSPDGRYLFFASARLERARVTPPTLTFEGMKKLALTPGANGCMAIYWVQADFIARLRAKAIWGN